LIQRHGYLLYKIWLPRAKQPFSETLAGGKIKPPVFLPDERAKSVPVLRVLESIPGVLSFSRTRVGWI
jgi:hypothetical protein